MIPITPPTRGRFISPYGYSTSWVQGEANLSIDGFELENVPYGGNLSVDDDRDAGVCCEGEVATEWTDDQIRDAVYMADDFGVGEEVDRASDKWLSIDVVAWRARINAELNEMESLWDGNNFTDDWED